MILYYVVERCRGNAPARRRWVKTDNTLGPIEDAAIFRDDDPAPKIPGRKLAPAPWIVLLEEVSRLEGMIEKINNNIRGKHE